MMPSAQDSEPLVETLAKLHTSHPACGCVSMEPAWKWDFGTVVGNGSQGALAFCRTSTEEFVLSHEELFLPLFPDHGYLPLKEHYSEIRQLVLDGKAAEAQDLIRQLKVDGDFPVYNTTDPFVGACSLDLLMSVECEYDSYVRSVDFASGEALTAWRDATGLYHRRFFFSRACDAMVLQLSSPTRSKLNLSIGLREIAYILPTDPKDHDMYEKTIDRCEGSVSETLLTHRMHFKRRWESQPVYGCCTLAKVITRGGEVSADAAQLKIADADELLLIVRTVPDRRGGNLSVEDEAASLDKIEADYDALLKAHAEIHGEMFGRCSLQLSDPGEQLLSTDSLQAESSVGDTSPALVEKAFAGARYGIISSTGKLPPALQGVWTGTWKPCWSGDYTLNGNVQSMVAASLCGNHFECMETVVDYMDSLMDDFRENARDLLGFRGPLIPWRSSTHGRTHYLAYKQYHHDFPGVYWFAGAGWFAQLYYDYYLYTGNEAFFEKSLKPFLLESAAFYEDYLTLEQDGVYVLSPSSSPENETSDNVWMAPNATMTIAAIKQLLRTVLRLEDKLGVSPAQVEKWAEMLSKMPKYQVGKNGALKEWSWPGIENEEGHRHASHLYPIYYGMDPEIAESDDLKEACRVAIDRRMEHRRHDNGGFMAFGFTQLGMSAAHLSDTSLAYESIEYLVNNYWSPVMVSQHNRDKFPDVLNMDISGGFPAIIITMLVQSLLPEKSGDPWLVRLLPCLPGAWPKGALRGVRCRGGFEVDISWENGKLEAVSVTSRLGGSCRIVYGDLVVELQLNQGEQCSLTSELKRR